MAIDNVVIIAIDDWRRERHPQLSIPKITSRLIPRSVVFDAAMVPIPSCSGSRTATFGGQAPWLGQGPGRMGAVWNNQGLWSDVYPLNQRLSLVGRMKDKGMATKGWGKVLHSVEDPDDWDSYEDLATDQFPKMSQAVIQGLIPQTFDFGRTPDGYNRLRDPRHAQRAADVITAGMTGQCIVFGSHRPHYPCIVPKRFWDVVTTGTVQVPPEVVQPYDPYDDTRLAGLSPTIIQQVVGPNRKVAQAVKNTGEYLTWVHAYLAATAYMDNFVGIILDKIEANNLWDNTLVILWGDNGYHLGSKNCARKFTLWEESLATPLMIACPGMTPRTVTQPVSSLDLYPTLVELLNLEAPHELDGQSLVPVLEGADPTTPALSGWALKRDNKRAMRVRTATHSYIHYWDGSIEAYELGPDPYERNNLAAQPGNSAIIDELEAMLPPQPWADMVYGNENE